MIDTTNEQDNNIHLATCNITELYFDKCTNDNKQIPMNSHLKMWFDIACELLYIGVGTSVTIASIDQNTLVMDRAGASGLLYSRLTY